MRSSATTAVEPIPNSQVWGKCFPSGSAHQIFYGLYWFFVVDKEPEIRLLLTGVGDVNKQKVNLSQSPPSIQGEKEKKEH